jgi:hypothetical protein
MGTVATNLLAAGVKADAFYETRTTSKVMVNGDTIFSIVGDILVQALVSECYTANDTTASTLQYSVTNSSTSTSQTVTGASPSLASAPIGSVVINQFTTLATAPTLTTASGVGLEAYGSLRVSGNSIITTVVGVGSTTGVWKHYIRYIPLQDGAYVTPAF